MRLLRMSSRQNCCALTRTPLSSREAIGALDSGRVIESGITCYRADRYQVRTPDVHSAHSLPEVPGMTSPSDIFGLARSRSPEEALACAA